MPVLATLFMAGFSGCDVLHDDLSDCELTLQFRYDYTMEGKDLFTEQVQEVKVFIFDDNGKFLREFIESGEPLKATGCGYPTGTKTAQWSSGREKRKNPTGLRLWKPATR